MRCETTQNNSFSICTGVPEYHQQDSAVYSQDKIITIS